MPSSYKKEQLGLTTEKSRLWIQFFLSEKIQNHDLRHFQVLEQAAKLFL